jgi:hypothetical protein
MTETETKAEEGTAQLISAPELILSVLAREEQQRKKKLELIIRDGLQTFNVVGNALLEIRDHRLYRDTHISFESYCRDKWGITKTHANRLIGASRVVENIKEVGPIPHNEATVRPMTGLQPDQQRTVWEKVTARVDDPKSVTSHIVTRVVNELVGDERREAKRREKPRARRFIQRAAVLAAVDAWALNILGRKNVKFTTKDHNVLRSEIEKL